MAAKYGVSADVLMQKANREHWKKDRDKVFSKTTAVVQQKVANAASDNAAVAQRIKAKLLKKIEKEIDSLPEKMGSEYINGGVEYGKNEKGNKIRKEVSHVYKLRDLAAAYKDLTSDMDVNGKTEPVRIVIDV